MCIRDRQYLEQTPRAQYEIQVDFAGPCKDDPKELKVLGRIITYTATGITYEPDPGHMEAVVHELGLGNAKGVVTPGIKEDSDITAAELLSRRKGYEIPPFRSRIHGGDHSEGVGSIRDVGRRFDRRRYY